MLFHSFSFLVFFPVVVALYFVAPPKHRPALLLAASYYFYAAWKPEYLLLIMLSTAVDYLVALRLGKNDSTPKRRALLLVSLGVNLGVLFVFKYLGFFSAALSAVAGTGDWSLDVLLPVGISFYTFQTLGYTIDVYRRDREPERDLVRFALYVSFFPQLVAGPIERSTRLLPQLEKTHRFDVDRVLSGLGLMLWGLFKKMVIADRAARIVDVVYADPAQFQGPTIVVATYAFAFQIYCDFSGYSDIAVGAARVMGYDLMENFDRPYAAVSIRDFWRRWHISLSTWFRDYLYIPLGGKKRRLRSIFVVFLLSGLWHGANWTFVVWGAYHGVLLVITLAVARVWKPTSRLWHWLGIFVTFHLVCFGWVIFRADDLSVAMTIVSQIGVTYPTSIWHELTHLGPRPPAANVVDLAILLLSLAALELRRFDVKRVELRTLAFASLCVWLVVAGVQQHTPFIYFQF